MRSSDFTNTTRFDHVSDVVDTERCEPGGASPVYEIYYEYDTGNVFQVYRRRSQWRMASPSTDGSAPPYGTWFPLN